MPSVNKVIYGNQTLIDLTDATASADTILEGYTAYGANGQKITGTVTAGGAVIIRDEQDVGGGTIRYITASSAYYLQDSKEVTPTKSVQNVTPDTGYNAFETVKVNPIPNEYIVPSGTSNITENGTYGVSTYASVAVNVQPDLSSLTVTPTESAQAFPPSGFLYDGYSTVNVGAISSTYVGTGITRRSASNLTASGSTVTVPSGYYSSQVTKNVNSVALAKPSISFNGTTGIITATETQGEGYVTGGTTTSTMGLTTRSSADLTFTTGTGVFTAPNGYYNGATTYTLTPKTSSNITVNGSAVTTGAGYYSSAITVNVASTPLAQPAITLNNTTGLITATTTQGTGYVTGGTSTSTYSLTTVAAQTITPTTASQLAVASGRFTTGSVYVGEIPSTYVQPTGTVTISTNGTYDVTEYASAFISVAGGEYYEVYKAIALNSILSSGVTGLEAFCNTVSVISQAAFAGRTWSGDYTFSNLATIPTGGFMFLSEAILHTNCSFTFNLLQCSTIGSEAFRDNKNLRFINASQCLQINNEVFSGCLIEGIDVPLCSRVGSGAFYSCSQLTSISLPSLRTLGERAFFGCSRLNTVYMPQINIIGSYVFTGCNALEYLYTQKISLVGNYGFSGCYNLSSINLLSCSSVYLGAFMNCSALTIVNAPELMWVQSSAFTGCIQLNTVILSNVRSIYSRTFAGCYNLLSLYLLGSSIPSLTYTAFSSTPISTYTTSTGGVYGSIFVRASLYDSYLTAYNWSQYSSRFVSLTDAQIEALGF